MLFDSNKCISLLVSDNDKKNDKDFKDKLTAAVRTWKSNETYIKAS
jgi:hypothetical protein